MRYLLALALLLTAASAQAQCPNGTCPLQLKSGEPVKNALKAPVIVAAKVAKAAVVVPAKVVKGTAHVFKERKPVRRALRFCGRVVLLRGPIASRVRAHRCH